MDNDPKHTAKATQDLNAKKWDIHQWPSQSDLNSKEQAFQLLMTKLKAEQTTAGSRNKSLAKHLKGGNSAFGDIYGVQIFGSL